MRAEALYHVQSQLVHGFLAPFEMAHFSWCSKAVYQLILITSFWGNKWFGVRSLAEDNT